MLFPDEAGFTRNSILNFHYRHILTDINPHNTIQSRHQQQFSISAWADIVGNCFIGTRFASHTQWCFLLTSFGAHFARIIGYCATGYLTKCVVHA
jgi:hypothetical protein